MSSGYMGSINVDGQAPTGSVTATPTACTNGTINLTLSPSDAPSGVVQSWGDFNYHDIGVD